MVHDLVPGAPLSARGTSSDRGPASKMQTLPSGLEQNPAMEFNTESFLMVGFMMDLRWVHVVLYDIMVMVVMMSDD